MYDVTVQRASITLPNPDRRGNAFAKLVVSIEPEGLSVAIVGDPKINSKIEKLIPWENMTPLLIQVAFPDGLPKQTSRSR